MNPNHIRLERYRTTPIRGERVVIERFHTPIVGGVRCQSRKCDRSRVIHSKYRVIIVPSGLVPHLIAHRGIHAVVLPRKNGGSVGDVRGVQCVCHQTRYALDRNVVNGGCRFATVGIDSRPPVKIETINSRGIHCEGVTMCHPDTVLRQRLDIAQAHGTIRLKHGRNNAEQRGRWPPICRIVLITTMFKSDNILRIYSVYYKFPICPSRIIGAEAIGKVCNASIA